MQSGDSVVMITKSDCLEFRDAPLHLCARKQGKIEFALSLYDQHLLDQGKEVEKLAREFLAGYLGDEGNELALTYERTFIDAHHAPPG